MSVHRAVASCQIAAAALLLLLTNIGFVAAQTPTILDDFEYDDFVTNHGWVGGGFSPNSVHTSTDQHFGGGQRSVLIPQGANIALSLNLADSIRSISIMYYDSLITGNNYDTNAWVFFSGGTCNGAAIGFYNPPTYYGAACGQEFTSLDFFRSPW